MYLYTGFGFGMVAGGSLGHIGGVVNNLEDFWDGPIFLASTKIRTVRSDVEAHCIDPVVRYWDFGEEWACLSYNEQFVSGAQRIIANRPVAFVYQRYSLNNYAGARLAKAYDAPFVLEYNSSEVWMKKYWGGKLSNAALAESIELLNLQTADLLVVVSRPLKEELISRGIAGEKILVNPNGVDTEVYRPDIDGTDVRRKHGLTGKTVVGFIGTFGQWHGADLLVEALATLVLDDVGLRRSMRLLMIGDGPTMPAVKQKVAEYEVEDTCVFTGLVSQDLGPRYLAACDILVAPHLPNPDGTTFFGSPTKLFEYMAMGKAILASDLGQIGEVLEHNRTGWLAAAGDLTSLKAGLRTLAEDASLRLRLGRSARGQVVERFTWQEHTRRISERVRACL